MKENKNELVERVKACKELIKSNPKLSKRDFFDTAYGKMTFTDFTKLENLWRCLTTEKDFTEYLEAYCAIKIKNS